MNGPVDDVKSLRIAGSESGISVSSAKIIQKNVVTGAIYYGISVSFAGSSTNSVDNNYISMDPSAGDGVGIYVFSGLPGSGSGPKVEKNYVENYNTFGIWVSTNGKVRVLSNVIRDHGDAVTIWGDPIYNEATATIDGNLCTELTFYCPIPSPPFLLP